MVNEGDVEEKKEEAEERETRKGNGEMGKRGNDFSHSFKKRERDH